MTAAPAGPGRPLPEDTQVIPDLKSVLPAAAFGTGPDLDPDDPVGETDHHPCADCGDRFHRQRLRHYAGRYYCRRGMGHHLTPAPTTDEPGPEPAPPADVADQVVRPLMDPLLVDHLSGLFALADGVRDMATVLFAAAGAVPVGDVMTPLVPLVVHTVMDGPEPARRAEVDRVAALLGVAAGVVGDPRPAGFFSTAPVYAAERAFGPVAYRVETRLDPGPPPPPPAAAAAIPTVMTGGYPVGDRLVFVDDTLAVPGARPPRPLAGVR